MAAASERALEPAEVLAVAELRADGVVGLGEADLAKIEIVGPALKDYIKTYKLPDNMDQQMIWMKPA